MWWWGYTKQARQSLACILEMTWLPRAGRRVGNLEKHILKSSGHPRPPLAFSVCVSVCLLCVCVCAFLPWTPLGFPVAHANYLVQVLEQEGILEFIALRHQEAPTQLPTAAFQRACDSLVSGESRARSPYPCPCPALGN